MKVLEKIRAASKKAVAARADLQVEVEGLRNELSSLFQERTRLLKAPLTTTETADNIKRALDALEVKAGERLRAGQFRANDPAKDPPDIDAVFKVGNGVAGPGGGFVNIINHELAGALCVLGLRSLMEPALLAKAVADSPGEGISASERAAKLRKIDADIEAVELAEEALIRECEEAGITVFRRSDARPEIYLREKV
ncbi:hypothetical protein GR200_20710 [Rhizobium leguminosarum]|uniref:hypothetical protein n=1 Tax=Rhizobium leguminosarum TaxID=384 RepID=UPI0013B8E31D|nr:hypothetical protein [Rhizobium leguminosarum]NEI57464.1 hypothetical protein [Rhizobium leguminosarum]NEI86324.1 hypothetical protein [Rhizobium leguminosarum]